MTDRTPTATELEFQKVFLSNIITDGWYVLLFTVLNFSVMGFTRLGASLGMVGETWSWLSSTLSLILSVAFLCSAWLSLLNLLLMQTDGDTERVRAWCRWKVVVALLMLHTHSRASFQNLLQRIEQQELEDAMV